MFRFSIILLLSIIIFNSYSFAVEMPTYTKIVSHGLFMPAVGFFYGVMRNWKFNKIDVLIFLSCSIGLFCDSIIFFDLEKRGIFLQMVANCFVSLLLILVFRKEGAFVFNIAKTNILKVIIPAVICFLFFGFVLMDILPNVLFFVGILYTVELTIFATLAYFRPVSKKSFWLVAIGVTVLMIRDILYSYYFYIYHGTQTFLYIPLYLSNAIGYFLIIYGVATNQNENNIGGEKNFWKVFLELFNSLFREQDSNNIQSRIYESKIL